MLTGLDAVVRRLVEAYEPERIILFGSRARGEASSDAIVFLNSVYRGRYPTDEGLLPHGDPTSDEASTAVSGADRLVAFPRPTLAGQG